MTDKATIRQSILQKRLALSEEQVYQMSQGIQERLLKLPIWPKQGRVAIYASVKNEVMTQILFQRALESGLHVYFPRVEQGLKYYEVNGPDDLQRGSWSIPEPKMECAALLPEDSFQLMVIPGVVFRRDGYRVGYGRGFYDQYLVQKTGHPPVVGLAYDFQVVEDFVIDPWDQAVTAVISEKSVYPGVPAV